jgi:16S rRNA G966 N2-methylase RsmD
MDNYNPKLITIFPQLPSLKDYLNLKIDEDSYKFITSKEVALLITKIICKHLLLINKNPLHSLIIDYTAGVGGNVLSFSSYFKNVIAIEINNERYNYLLNNLSIYNCNNVSCVNINSIDYNNTQIKNINPDIIFIDIPWGSSWNKSLINYKVGFDSYEIFEQFIIDIFDKCNTQNLLIVLKLPKNYDIMFLFNYIKSKIDVDIYLYILHKMIVFVIKKN